MTNLQSHLDKRLAGLKKATKSGRAASTGEYSTKEIKMALKKSGLITSSGKVKTLIVNPSGGKIKAQTTHRS
jgi:hypothetical protein